METFDGIKSVLGPDNVRGVQEEVQLREQDFGNFQNAEGKHTEKAERLRFGRFFYRFPNGESGADVYDRCVCASITVAASPAPAAPPAPSPGRNTLVFRSRRQLQIARRPYSWGTQGSGRAHCV